jgi:Family of unknown function (DUF5761)
MDERVKRLGVQTPLSLAFFSEFNRELIHNDIISSIREKTGYTIKRQNDFDLQALMRKVYTDLVQDPMSEVTGQVSRMNKQVVKEATSTISTGMLQQLVYMRDISANPVPLAVPISTSTYGNKLPYNTKISF